VRLVCWLKSIIVAPEHLAILGSVFDFAGPRVSRKFRLFLFRMLGGALAADFYLYRSETHRLRALLIGLVSGALCRVKTHNLEKLPDGGVLLLPNHTTGFDAVALQLACPRPIRFLVRESTCQHRWLNPVLRLAGTEAIPISKDHAKESILKAVEYIEKGEIVCIFPEGQLNPTGALHKLHKGFGLIARLANCNVVPVWLDGLGNPIFLFKDGRFVCNFPERIPPLTTIVFGRPTSAGSIDTGVAREKLLELSEVSFQCRPELSDHLGRVTIKGLRRHQFDDAVIDGDRNRGQKRGDLLATCIALSRWIKKKCANERVAIVLPPGVDALIANVAVTLAGKRAVNFDLKSSSAAIQSAIDRGKLLHAISSEPMIKRLEGFVWPKISWRLEEMIAELRIEIKLWRIVSLFAPAWLLGDLLGLPRKGDQKEAAVLFLSDRAGEPVEVVLSHRNVMANVTQLSSTLNMSRYDSLMADPSFFYSCGCALTIWYPLIKGVRTVTYSDLASFEQSAELVERYAVRLLVTTPNALRAYLRHAAVQDFEGIRMLISSVDAPPGDLNKAFERKFNKPVFEGYWHGESASLISVNLPDPAPKQTSSRVGSVGKLIRGQAAQIRHPETGETLSPYKLGTLWLRGPNILRGFLHNPEKGTDGWFCTAELARFDEDGFLYIERSASSFPEIGSKQAQNQPAAVRAI
jgi:acyl-[acyl-carrier-protein]-phospholipid O-acyltransferase / long-chain-fatty-acid--[acyl-carrier-protein] ligase